MEGCQKQWTNVGEKKAGPCLICLLASWRYGWLRDWHRDRERGLCSLGRHGPALWGHYLLQRALTPGAEDVLRCPNGFIHKQLKWFVGLKTTYPLKIATSSDITTFKIQSTSQGDWANSKGLGPAWCLFLTPSTKGLRLDTGLFANSCQYLWYFVKVRGR